jgi:hypothetical protein
MTPEPSIRENRSNTRDRLRFGATPWGGRGQSGYSSSAAVQHRWLQCEADNYASIAAAASASGTTS